MFVIFRTDRGETFQTTEGDVTVTATVKKFGVSSIIECSHNLKQEEQLPALLRHLAERFQHHRIP